MSAHRRARPRGALALALLAACAGPDVRATVDARALARAAAYERVEPGRIEVVRLGDPRVREVGIEIARVWVFFDHAGDAEEARRRLLRAAADLGGDLVLDYWEREPDALGARVAFDPYDLASTPVTSEAVYYWVSGLAFAAAVALAFAGIPAPDDAVLEAGRGWVRGLVVRRRPASGGMSLRARS